VATVTIEVTNRRPEAGADLYVLEPGQENFLVEPPEGLLVNDFDPDDDTLIDLVLGQNVRHGTPADSARVDRDDQRDGVHARQSGQQDEPHF
jgi:hypothetical protein